MAGNEFQEYSPKEEERVKRREKKRKPSMGVSGRSVLELARLIKLRGEEGTKRKKSKRKKKRKKK
ncbi:hypothetical protein GTO10_05600 [Candidatus Saccharibacteria bacterium]|nr:hypothetical protein [Candidatus Saccharibacteria bacterium]